MPRSLASSQGCSLAIMALSNRTLTIAVWYGVTLVKLCVINYSDSSAVRHQMHSSKKSELDY